MYLKLNRSMPDRQIERETGVPAQTLRDHVKNGVKKGALGRPTIFTLEEERALAEYVFIRQDMHAPVNTGDLAEHIAEWFKKDDRMKQFGKTLTPGKI
jgi:predicted transcriptional regulator